MEVFTNHEFKSLTSLFDDSVTGALEAVIRRWDAELGECEEEAVELLANVVTTFKYSGYDSFVENLLLDCSRGVDPNNRVADILVVKYIVEILHVQIYVHVMKRGSACDSYLATPSDGTVCHTFQFVAGLDGVSYEAAKSKQPMRESWSEVGTVIALANAGCIEHSQVDTMAFVEAVFRVVDALGDGREVVLGPWVKPLLARVPVGFRAVIFIWTHLYATRSKILKREQRTEIMRACVEACEATR